MNSSGLGSLIATMKAVEAASGEIVLMGVNDRLINLLIIISVQRVRSEHDDWHQISISL